MKKRYTARLVAAALTVGLVACMPQGQAADPLVQHRQQWTQQTVKNYRYTFQKQCFCLTDATQPVVVEVRNGASTSIVAAQGGAPVDPALFSAYDTVDELFQIVQEAKNTNAAEVVVAYDSTYGFPTSIKLDQSKQTADDETAYLVSGFEVIK